MFLKFISTNSTGIRETFGKFGSILTPGLNFFIPCVQSIHEVSNKIHEDNHVFEIKTKDNVFTRVQISLQLQVDTKHSYQAFYNWSNPHAQMKSYINDIVRSKVPNLTLDELYASTTDISDEIVAKLSGTFQSNGYTIIKALVNNIEPDAVVKQAMNNINASQRNMAAAKNNAEANFITAIREAEADKAKKKLIGEGIADQRKAILEGYRAGMGEMSKELDVTPREILDFVMNVQKLEMLQSVSNSENAKVIFVNDDVGVSKGLIAGLETK